LQGAPDGNLILVLAKEYGQSPETVEQWDAYWFERAAVELRGRAIYDEKRERIRRQNESRLKR
jgi:hypothetical protein